MESSSLSKADRFHLLTERFHLIFRQLVQQLFQTKPGAAYHIMGQQDNLIAPKRGRYAVFYQLLRIRVDDRVLQTGILVIIYVTPVRHLADDSLTRFLIVGIDAAARKAEQVCLHTCHFVHGLSCLFEIRHIAVHTLI